MNGECGGSGELTVRSYGDAGPVLVVVHGGPGAPGYMAPVCRELSDVFTVMEPFQRLSGAVPLTVARHVSDLRDVCERLPLKGAVTLIGHSWGAMLALAFAAEHPNMVRNLVLIGCGTFDAASRRTLEAAVEMRTTPGVRVRLKGLPLAICDADARMCVSGRLLEGVYSYELAPHRDETESYDSRGHNESWRDMLRLQGEGVYPARFARIDARVLMLHGADDPHPGRAIRDSLSVVIPHMEYIELPRCGHYPWWERHAKDGFYRTLRDWLACNAT